MKTDSSISRRFSPILTCSMARAVTTTVHRAGLLALVGALVMACADPAFQGEEVGAEPASPGMSAGTGRAAPGSDREHSRDDADDDAGRTAEDGGIPSTTVCPDRLLPQVCPAINGMGPSCLPPDHDCATRTYCFDDDSLGSCKTGEAYSCTQHRCLPIDAECAAGHTATPIRCGDGKNALCIGADDDCSTRTTCGARDFVCEPGEKFDCKSRLCLAAGPSCPNPARPLLCLLPGFGLKCFAKSFDCVAFDGAATARSGAIGGLARLLMRARATLSVWHRRPAPIPSSAASSAAGAGAGAESSKHPRARRGLGNNTQNALGPADPPLGSWCRRCLPAASPPRTSQCALRGGETA
jgi:hypothetical protein